MIKLIKWILFGLASIGFVVTFFLDPFNLVMIYIKYVSLFVLIALILGEIMWRIIKSLSQHYHFEKLGKRIMIGVSVGVFMVMLGVTYYVENAHFLYKETFVEAGCRYYDQYQNLIYQSTSKRCPTLTVHQINNNQFVYTINEVNTHQLDTLDVNGTDFENVTFESNKTISGLINYLNGVISYAHIETVSATTFNGDAHHKGLFSKTIQTIDYRFTDAIGYVFQEAIIEEEIDGTFEEVTAFDPSTIEIESSDYDVTTFRLEGTTTGPTHQFYDMVSVVVDGDDVLREKQFEVAVPLASSVEDTSFYINGESTTEDDELGVIGRHVVIDQAVDQKNVLTIIEYEGESYYNDYRYRLEDGIFLIDTVQTRHYTTNGLDYEINRVFNVFERNGYNVYYRMVVEEGESSISEVLKYRTYETVYGGYRTRYYDTIDGSFWHYLLNKDASPDTSYNLGLIGPNTFFDVQYGYFVMNDLIYSHHYYNDMGVLPPYID
jgi:hypothetical protein